MTNTDFRPLIAELDNWSTEPAPATFWWRDDDAVAPSNELDSLLDIAHGRPLALATVPFYASEALSRRIANEPNVTIFQHGWKHQNHAAEGPNSEYPPGRPTDIVAREISDGSAKLSELFGGQFAPVFTPPWHGFDRAYLGLLMAAGLKGLSSKGRRAAAADAGVVQNNIHCIPIEWSTPPGFGNPARYIGQLVNHLKRRRSGNDREEGTGILTHHLVQTRESLEFVRGVLDVITTHANAKLVHPCDLFFGDYAGLSDVDLMTVRRAPISPSTTV
ncbi:MAG: hypothetical protein ACJ8FT_07670 [Sphingomonas sp.]